MQFPDTARVDSLLTLPPDSALTITLLPDSAALADSLGKMRIPAMIGSFDRGIDSSSVITAEGMHRIDFRYAGDLLASFPGTFPIEQSSEGQYSTVAFRGVDWRGFSVSVDGLGVNDPASGIFNLYGIALEEAERIEIVTGPRAFLYGLNAAGAAVNFVTKNYNSNRPLSRIGYAESGSGYSLSDGTFSQNVTRRLNVTAGFQSRNSDGLFPNSLHESWLARVKLRYHLTSDLLLLLTERFTGTITGLSGGVDFDASGPVRAFQPVQATMFNTDAYEKITRHDAGLTFVGTIPGDTAQITSLSLYYSSALREYRDEENRTPPNGIRIASDHRSSWMGAQLRQELHVAAQALAIGAHLEIRQIEGSPNLGRRRNVIGALWARDEVQPMASLTLSAYGRYDRYLNENYWGAGGDARLMLGPEVSLFGGASRFRRVPTYQELYWSDSTVFREGTIGAEKHAVVEAGADFRFWRVIRLRLSYTRRVADDVIGVTAVPAARPFPSFAFSVFPRVTSDCVEAAVSARIWLLTLEGNAQWIEQRTGDGVRLDALPKQWLSGGLYFDNTIVDGHLDLKAGFAARFLAGYRGDRFNPETLTYVPHTGSPLPRNGSVDFVLLAHLGDASIHFIWENLTDARYFMTPWYPDQARQIRFGISWQFLD